MNQIGYFWKVLTWLALAKTSEYVSGIYPNNNNNIIF